MYSKVTLSAEAQACLLQLHNTLLTKQYSVRTIRNYVQEMRFLFAHYYDVLPQSISQPDIINYITFIIKAHGVGREKCHQVAQACSFYYKFVYPSSFIVSSAFYPRKTNKLPQVFSNRHRIIAITEHTISFKYKHYADSSRQKTMAPAIPEFLRRFELHFLPRQYVKIRHYGFLQNHGKTARLNAVRKKMKLPPLPPKINIPVAQGMLEKYDTDITLCPQCKQGRLVLVKVVYPKAGPVVLSPGIDAASAIRNKASP